MRGVAPRIESQEAERRLRRRSFRRPSADRAPSPRRLELAWLPYFLVRLEMETAEGSRRLLHMVDAIGGGAARLRSEAELDVAVPQAETLRPRLRAFEAEAAARALHTRTQLTLRGSRRHRLGATEGIELVFYPYWIYTYERRPGRFDVRILDAVSGRPAGSAVKRSILFAFVDEHRAAPVR